MALINRISRLFTADLHAVLDRIEEPQALLKQALREMEAELAKAEQRVKFLETEDRQLGAREAELARALGEIEEKLDLCFESDQPDLARAQVKRKLETERLAKILAQRRAGIAETLAAQRAALNEDQARLDGLRQKAEALDAQTKTPDAGEGDWTGAAFPVGDDEVEVAFLRERQRRAQ